ncbi:MAG: cell division protein FtsA [Acidobacteriota bacterium]|nr:cell division protein FtsA [Blastocatellia bacterium]MDW8412258.1 cell division protein FtsA [Acidobacteriota bacterium]
MPKVLQVVGLDVGTTRVRVVIAEVNGGNIEVVGVGTANSKGLRKGVVVNIDSAVESIKRALEAAEQMSGTTVEQAYVGLGGAHIRSYNSKGVVAISRKNREITVEDIRRVVDQASAVSVPSDREIVDVVPQEFTVDEQDGIGDPLGMLGMRLEVVVHIVTSPITAKQNIVTSVNRSGIIVIDTVLDPLAAAEAVLTEEEREYGTALIDIGGETTKLAIFHRGAIRHTAVFPLGGNHFTNDIAVGLRTPIPAAERIKRQYGCTLSGLLSENERQSALEIPNVGGQSARSLSRYMLCEILQARAEEIFAQVHQEIQRMGFDTQISSGVVLTGGGCLLSGMREMAEQVLDLPARLGGAPKGIGGLSDEIASPEYATALGLVVVGCKSRLGGVRSYLRTETSLRSRASRLREWIAGIF